jgi:hypothetical protein
MIGLTPLKQYLTSLIEWLPLDISGIIPLSLPDQLDKIFIGSDSGVDKDANWVVNFYTIGLIEIPVPLFQEFVLRIANTNNSLSYGKVSLKILLGDKGNKLLGLGFFGQIALKIPTSTLGPAKKVNGKYVQDLSKSTIIELADAGIILNTNGTISLDNKINVNIEESFIGETSILCTLKNISCNTNNASVEFTFDSASVILPEAFIIPTNTEILISNAKINNKGFSGNCSVDLPLTYNNKKFYAGDKEATIFGIPGGLKHISISIENNQPSAFNLEGQLLVPYFNEPVDVKFTIDRYSEISVVLTSIGNGKITLTKDQLIKLSIESLMFKKEGSQVLVSICGGIEPLLFSNEGMKWPIMDVKNLKIDSTGKFSIDEAWLDLKDMATLDLFGFHLELQKIGFGNLTENNTDKLWIDLSGGLKLIEQVPIGVDIEGFRLIWPKDLTVPSPITPTALQNIASQIGIQFKGVQFSFGVPNAVKVDGLLRFFKDAQAVGFAGDMVLVIPPAGITAEAGLLIGMNTEQPKPYPFFYVYFGLEAAAGIPLGQSGLALKGAQGLFGINVAPNKQQQENWYYDWYKKAPGPGAHQTTKWTYQRDSLAIGAGLTITTVDGVVKGTKGVMVLALPGPILVINGRAIILNGLNSNSNAEPPFSATAIFDGKEKIVQFNIEAQAEIVKNIVEARASSEAFFDFKDITNWHLYLGQDEPIERRIRANILKVVEADAYLMLDMLDANSPRARMGVEVSAKPHIDDVCFDLPFNFRPCIRFDTHLNLGGSGVVALNPDQFSGQAHIDAGVTITALVIKLSIGASANISIEGSSPASLEANLGLHADLPDPLPDYQGNMHYRLEIPEVNLNINNPLVNISLFSRFTSESRALIGEDNTRRSDDNYLSQTVYASCDISPILSFEHEMNQDNNCGFVMHPNGIKTYDVGAMRFTPIIRRIVIREKEKSANSTWNIVYSTVSSDNKPLIGVWLAEADPASPSQPSSRRLQLMTTNPLTNTMHYPGMEGGLMMQSDASIVPLSEQILTDYPDLMTCTVPNISPSCIDFNYSGTPLRKKRIRWGEIELIHSEEVLINDNCLYAKGALDISFLEAIVGAEIIFCTNFSGVTIKTFARPEGEELVTIVKEASLKKKHPDLSCTKEIDNKSIGRGAGIQVVGVTPFHCIRIETKSESIIQIKSVCYFTEKAKINYDKNKKICQVNTNLISTQPSSFTNDGSIAYTNNNLFKPGCYYEIETETLVTGLVKNIGNAFIEQLYQNFVGQINKQSINYSYFQTEAPPQNLNPYIKWSLPEHQSSNVYCTDPIVIRFKRGYLSALFGNNSFPAHKLRAAVKNAQGEIKIFDQNKLTWSFAGSSTLFPDEETWITHLSQSQIQSYQAKDSILKIEVDNVLDFYRVNNRYELVLIGSRNNTISNGDQAKDKPVIKLSDGNFYNILSSKLLTTSRFASFDDLIKSGGTDPNKNTVAPIQVKGNSIAFASSFSDLSKAWADAEILYYKTSVDFQFGIANYINGSERLVSKEAFEKTKLILREAKDKVDDEFRRLAMLINPELIFADAGKATTIFAVQNQTSPNIEYFWIKLPEAINLKKMNQTNAVFGNTDLNIVFNNTPVTNRIYNSDTSQIIIKLDVPVLAEMKEFRIKFFINRDYSDDVNTSTIFGTLNNFHHRYDRASLKGLSPLSFDYTLDF